MLGCMYSPMADATEPWWLYYLQKKTFWCEFWLRLVLFCIMWRCFTLEKEKNSQDMLYEMNVLTLFFNKNRAIIFAMCCFFVSKFWQFQRGNASELAAARGWFWTETFRPLIQTLSRGSIWRNSRYCSQFGSVVILADRKSDRAVGPGRAIWS